MEEKKKTKKTPRKTESKIKKEKENKCLKLYKENLIISGICFALYEATCLTIIVAACISINALRSVEHAKVLATFLVAFVIILGIYITLRVLNKKYKKTNNQKGLTIIQAIASLLLGFYIGFVAAMMLP